MKPHAKPEAGADALVKACAGMTEAAAIEGDPNIERVRRLGRRLFDVSNCLVLFSHASSASGYVQPLDAAESAFARAFALSDVPVIVLDARAHPVFGEHRCVRSAPFIRFYAAHPVRNEQQEVVGAVALVDYAPRLSFDACEQALLADLAALVEHELRLRSMNASQLELQKKNKNLRRKSLIDPLIGTWNRGAIMRILAIESARCDKACVPLSLIVVDLDHFKQINDRFGHPAGDAVLVKMASRLRSCIRPQEALGRYGGEEFLVVLPAISHDAAMAVAERMRAAVAAQPETVAGVTLQLTISAGVASTDLFPNASGDELINRADMALYAAKDAGRNRVAKAAPELL
ncbi:MAG TPA: sensor domain-containing diguanylate cyclase [Noviherbaspirillum sp.]